MESLVYLIPIAFGVVALALVAFFWTVKSNQYEDMKGAAERILIEDEEDRPL